MSLPSGVSGCSTAQCTRVTQRQTDGRTDRPRQGNILSLYPTRTMPMPLNRSVSAVQTCLHAPLLVSIETGIYTAKPETETGFGIARSITL